MEKKFTTKKLKTSPSKKSISQNINPSSSTPTPSKPAFSFFQSSIILILLSLLVVFSGCQDVRLIINEIDEKSKLKSQNSQIQIVQTEYNLQETINDDIIPIFCPGNQCLQAHLDLFESASEEIKCAFFEFDQINLSNKLLELSNKGITIEIIVDNNYLEEEPLIALKQDSKILILSDDPRTKFMHNKFCIIDEKTVLTGSTNPTDNGFFKNNNNILIIESKYISKNYLEEFNEMKAGKFGGEEKNSNSLYYNNITLKNPKTNQNYLISTYFCPENKCENKILAELEKAKTSITLANFVLTSNSIEELLIQKANEGITITALIENRMKNTQGSILGDLNKSFPVYLDTNPATMHHKVFVIDGNVVITGSMNPTASGNSGNDENVIIIENEKLAKQYEEEIFGLIS